MAFPADAELGTKVVLNVGGVWTDITPYTYLASPITITRGRADEGSRADYGRATIVLNNQDGRFSPRNPVGPYYGKIGRNSPIYVSVQAGSSYLDCNGGGLGGVGVSTPDTAALDILGDLDVRVDATLDNWITVGASQSVELAGKYNATGNQRSWLLQARDGGLHFEWSATGATVLQVDSTAKLTVPFSRRLAVRVVLDVDNGAAGNTVTFYTASSLAGTWTQLGNPIVTAGTTALFNSTAPVRVGEGSDLAFINPLGSLWAAEVRNGIGGTIVANPVFTSQTPGATSFTDSTGKTWTVGSNTSISNERVRFFGEVATWPVSWGVSGRDARASIQASGILRRLGQGAAPLSSTLRRRIPSFAPLGYWPMEEDANATRAYSPITGVRPATTSGITFASDDSLAGSSALPTLGSPASINATPLAGTGTWQVEFVYKIPTAPAGDANAQFLVVNSTGTARTWRIGVGAANLHIDVTDEDGNLLVSFVTATTNFFGTWNRFQLKCSQSGGNVAWQFRWITIGGGGLSINDVFAGTAGPVTRVSTLWSTVLQGMSVGHLAVFGSQTDAPFNSADQGFNAESAGTRMARLASEESLPLVVFGDTASQEAMGPQRSAAVLTLIGDAADADGGILYEQRGAIGLAYRDRNGLYNQPAALALDYAAPGLTSPLDPVDDDQSVLNDITVTRVGGSSARATRATGALSTQAPPNGVGIYDTAVTLNLANDDQPEQHANWRLHQGTWDEARFPSVRVLLHRAPELIDAASAVDSGDILTIANPPAWLPPDAIGLMARGYTETLGVRTWEIVFNCTPAGPWTVAVADDPVLGRADTDGSQLATAATSTATTLSVATTSGPVWTTDPAETPWDIRVGGEVVTVTAVGQVLNANPSFDTNVSGWTAFNGGTLAWAMSSIRQSGVGLLTTGAAASPQFQATPVTGITAGATYRASGWIFAGSALPAGVGINVNWYDAAGTYLSTSFNTRVPTVGTWALWDTVFTAPATAGRAGILLSCSGTPGAGIQVWGDDIKLIPVSTYNASPQTFTVTRSVNGVTKAQASGTDVRLANPMTVAL